MRSHFWREGVANQTVTKCVRKGSKICKNRCDVIYGWPHNIWLFIIRFNSSSSSNFFGLFPNSAIQFFLFPQLRFKSSLISFHLHDVSFPGCSFESYISNISFTSSVFFGLLICLLSVWVSSLFKSYCNVLILLLSLLTSSSFFLFLKFLFVLLFILVLIFLNV